MERAVTLLQCQMELCFFTPHQFAHLPRVKIVEHFELFFNTDLPLFGSNNANGWNKWNPTQQQRQDDLSPGAPTAASLDEEDEIDRLIVSRAPEGTTKAALWSYIEEARTARRIQPLPSNYPPTDDPERQVLYEDISRFLVKVRQIENKYRLLLLFLEFFNVDIHQCGTLDAFVPNPNFQSSFNYRHVLTFSNDHSCIRPKLVQYNTAVFEQFIENARLQMAYLLQEPFRTNLTCIFVKHQIKKASTDAAAGKSVKNLIRNILKEPSNRNNLAIWSLCSEIEMKFTGSVEAVRIAETAVNVAHQMKLYNSWGAMCGLAVQTVLFHFNFNPNNSPSPSLFVRLPNAIDVDTMEKVAKPLKLLVSCLLRQPIKELDLQTLPQLREKVVESVDQFANFTEGNSQQGEEGGGDDEQQLMPVEPLICQLAMCYALFLYLTDRILFKSSQEIIPLASCDQIFTRILNQVSNANKHRRELPPLAQIRRFCEQVTIRLHQSRITMALFDYQSNVKSITHLKEIVTCACNDFPNNAQFLQMLVSLKEPAAFLTSSFIKFSRSMSHRIKHPLAWLIILKALVEKVQLFDSSSGGDNLGL